MKHFYYGDIPLVNIGDDTHDAKRRWLVDQDSGATVSMMFVEVKPGGSTLQHSHPYEHTMFFLEGTGEIREENGVSPINPLEVIYIKPNEPHQIRNTGDKTLKFIAVEPTQKKEH
jgi:quercetin dioxygenase-like cupin family protein